MFNGLSKNKGVRQGMGGAFRSSVKRRTIADIAPRLFDGRDIGAMFQDAGKTIAVASHGDTVARVLGQSFEYEAQGTVTYDARGAIVTSLGCLQTLTSVPLIANDRTAFAIIQVKSEHTGYVYGPRSGSNGWTMRTDGRGASDDGIFEVFHWGGADRPLESNVVVGYGLTTPILVMWPQTSAGGDLRVDGVSKRIVDGTADALGTNLIEAIGGLPGGGNLFDGLIYMAGQAEGLDAAGVDELEGLLLERLAEIKSISLTLTTPDKTVFQTDASNANRATIRARGTWTGVGDVEVQYAGGGWVSVACIGGEFSHDFVNIDRGEGLLEVRAAGGVFTDSVTVGADDNIGVYGQSNGLGSSDNVRSYIGAILGAFRNPSDTVPVDPLGTSDKSWHADFLTDYITDTGRRTNLHIEGRGSTPGFAFEEDAAPYGGAETSLWDRFYRLIVSSQMLDPDTYNPATDGPVCLCVIYWQNETDAANGTSTASYEATLRSIATSMDTALAAPLFVPVLQPLDSGYATTINQDAIRVAQRNVRGDNAPGVAGHPNIHPGPDWSSTPFDTANGAHIANDANQIARAGEWSASIQAIFP